MHNTPEFRDIKNKLYEFTKDMDYKDKYALLIILIDKIFPKNVFWAFLISKKIKKQDFIDITSNIKPRKQGLLIERMGIVLAKMNEV